jgi:Cu(I)/Ag(I) efflux system membrane fusion protein
MKQFVICCLALALAACGGSDKKAKEQQNQPQGPLGKSANSEAFNRSFEKLMADYYTLKDNFIAEKDSGIAQSARSLMISADSLRLKELKADTTIIETAQTYTLGISSEIKGLLGEKNMDGKRKSFQVLSDQLYDLIRTVQYDRAIVYHDYCPMAFNDQGANWLSNSSEIRNPYIPKKMITCGEVKDSIDFRRK